jgi:RNA polymerase sigma factor (sigma-70 family)
LKAFCHLKGFQEKSSFSTWLTRIAINSALMILRKKRGWSEISLDGTNPSSDQYEQWEAKSPTEDPESGYVRRERKELLRNAILRLTPVVREVVQLRQVGDHSTREIAQALDISVPAVKSRLSAREVNLARSAASSSVAVRILLAELGWSIEARPVCTGQAFGRWYIKQTAAVLDGSQTPAVIFGNLASRTRGRRIEPNALGSCATGDNPHVRARRHIAEIAPDHCPDVRGAGYISHLSKRTTSKTTSG